jgi:hypothetical protein
MNVHNSYSNPMRYLALNYKRDPTSADACLGTRNTNTGGPRAEIGWEGVGGYEYETGSNGHGVHFVFVGIAS